MDALLPLFLQLIGRIVKWRFPIVDRVRSRYQSVSRKRQADMDDMGMKRGATANVTSVQSEQGS